MHFFRHHRSACWHSAILHLTSLSLQKCSYSLGHIVSLSGNQKSPQRTSTTKKRWRSRSKNWLEICKYHDQSIDAVASLALSQSVLPPQATPMCPSSFRAYMERVARNNGEWKQLTRLIHSFARLFFFLLYWGCHPWPSSAAAVRPDHPPPHHHAPTDDDASVQFSVNYC